MMNMRNLRKLGGVVLLASLLFTAACTKTEFLPEPEGAQVPFQSDATQTVEELLAASPAKLYYSAWQKSNIKNVLNQKGSKVRFTAFVPNDAAMQAAGLTTSAIGQMSVAELDDFILFSTTIGQVTRDELKLRDDNFMVKTLLENRDLYVPHYENPESNQFDYYAYRLYVGVKGDDLLVNGKNTGKLNYLPATNGGLFLMEKTVQKPTKTIIEALRADGRFTMFIESQRLADELYLDKMATDIEPLLGYKPEPEETIMYATQRLYYQKDWDIVTPYPGYGPNITISTLFAPTDEAFHKAGFQTVADILKFNERGASSIRFNDMTFTDEGAYPMDTVYNYHRNWGRMFQPVTVGGDKTISNATVFYSNALTPALNEYLVSAGGNPTIDYAYKMPLEFSLNGNSIQIKVKGSEYPAATVIEGDINTLNGPIHVVDRLFFPKGFKLN